MNQPVTEPKRSRGGCLTTAFVIFLLVSCARIARFGPRIMDELIPPTPLPQVYMLPPSTSSATSTPRPTPAVSLTVSAALEKHNRLPAQLVGQPTSTPVVTVSTVAIGPQRTAMPRADLGAKKVTPGPSPAFQEQLAASTTENGPGSLPADWVVYQTASGISAAVPADWHVADEKETRYILFTDDTESLGWSISCEEEYGMNIANMADAEALMEVAKQYDTWPADAYEVTSFRRGFLNRNPVSYAEITLHVENETLHSVRIFTRMNGFDCQFAYYRFDVSSITEAESAMIDQLLSTVYISP